MNKKADVKSKETEIQTEITCDEMEKLKQHFDRQLTLDTKLR